MSIKQYELWIADLNPQIGTEPGKTRPVLILQTNLFKQDTASIHDYLSPDYSCEEGFRNFKGAYKERHK